VRIFVAHFDFSALVRTIAPWLAWFRTAGSFLAVSSFLTLVTAPSEVAAQEESESIQCALGAEVDADDGGSIAPDDDVLHSAHFACAPCMVICVERDLMRLESQGVFHSYEPRPPRDE
jgi:hypothetical protein